MSTQELERTRAAWDGIAAGYDEFVTPTEVTLANDALGRVGLAAGVRFLDVAAGAGGLSLPAARIGARVTATDISPKMIERLLARAAAEGLEGVDSDKRSSAADALRDDLVSALANLGYHHQAIEKVLPKVIGDAQPPSFEIALRAVLKELSRG